MLDHHIQKNILYRLAFADSLRFSELKPDDIESKLFTYHLKKVIISGLVEKTPDGTYRLSPEGRRVGKGALLKDSRMINRAYSIIIMAVRRESDGAWLLSKRTTQPLLGLSGFMQTQPLPGTDSLPLASDSLHQKTGLAGDFEWISSGFFTIYKDELLESYIHFTLLLCEKATGELSQNDPLGEYYFDESPNFSDPSMLPTASVLADLLESRLAFTEQTFRI